MLDRSGQEIKMGDYILYLVKKYNFAEIAFARVMMIKDKTCTVQAWDNQYGEFRLSRLRANERILVIPQDLIPKEEYTMLRSVRP